MEKLLEFNSEDILRLLVSAIVIYVINIVYIRLLGKRSTSKLNNFDWIVTVSIGSITSSAIILEDVSILEGGIGILILLLLQFAVTKIMYHSEFLGKVIKSTPQLLLFEGEFMDDNMKRERIIKSEVYAAIRQKGLKSVEEIYAVVLETNSEISIIPNENSDEIGFSLSDVQGLPDGLKEDLKKQEKNSTETNIV